MKKGPANGKLFTDEDWNDEATLTEGPYPYSKVCGASSSVKPNSTLWSDASYTIAAIPNLPAVYPAARIASDISCTRQTCRYAHLTASVCHCDSTDPGGESCAEDGGRRRDGHCDHTSRVCAGAGA